MTKNKQENCEHEIGRKALGGFAGHEHIHPSGDQYCFNCGKTLEELLVNSYKKGFNEAKAEERARILKAIEKWNESGYMSDCLGELNREKLIDIIKNERKT